MPEPIIARAGESIAAVGSSFDLQVWSGSGPAYLHVHHQDDEAWHVLEGKLIFRFADSELEAAAGTTVFVPAGVPHTYTDPSGDSRYLMVLTPRLRELVRELHATPLDRHAEVMRGYASEILGSSTH
jgi:mannose-6-phosphate isomerase-like protein (cupin superfamily)